MTLDNSVDSLQPIGEFQIRAPKTIDLQIAGEDGYSISEVDAQKEVVDYATLYQRAQELIPSDEMRIAAQSLTEPATYLSQERFNTAIESFARRSYQLLQSNSEINICMCVPELTSDLFITTLVVNRLRSLYGPNLQDRIQIATLPEHMTIDQKTRFLFFDDFIVSGNQLGLNVDELITHLEKQGYTKEEIREKIELHIMLVPQHNNSNVVI